MLHKIKKADLNATALVVLTDIASTTGAQLISGLFAIGRPEKSKVLANASVQEDKSPEETKQDLKTQDKRFENLFRMIGIDEPYYLPCYDCMGDRFDHHRIKDLLQSEEFEKYSRVIITHNEDLELCCCLEKIIEEEFSKDSKEIIWLY